MAFNNGGQTPAWGNEKPAYRYNPSRSCLEEQPRMKEPIWKGKRYMGLPVVSGDVTWECYQASVKEYKKHIASLRSIPTLFTQWEDKELLEGMDFKIEYAVISPGITDGAWEKNQIAVPLSPSQSRFDERILSLCDKNGMLPHQKNKPSSRSQENDESYPGESYNDLKDLIIYGITEGAAQWEERALQAEEQLCRLMHGDIDNSPNSMKLPPKEPFHQKPKEENDEDLLWWDVKNRLTDHGIHANYHKIIQKLKLTYKLSKRI